MSHHRIEFSGPLNASCYRRFPAELDQARSLTLDLSEVQFCKPDGLVALSSLIDYAARRGAAIEIIPPRMSDPRVYMSRMRFPQFLEGLGVEHGLAPVNEHSARSRFVELSPFSDEKGVEGLASLVHGRFEPLIGSQAAASAFLSLSELGANVSQHARCPRGFYMAQQFERRNRFEFAIGDPGVGLKESLSRFSPASHEQAIGLAIQRGVSGVDATGRGEGLASIRERLKEAGGYLNLVSGNAEGYFAKQQARLTEVESKFFPGTLIIGSLPLSVS